MRHARSQPGCKRQCQDPAARRRGCVSVQAPLLRRRQCGVARVGSRAAMAFTIAHITDPHLSPAPMPRLADFRLKRFMGYVNWKRGRERLNDMAMLTRLVEDLRAQRPDHVAVTGDLVNIGMPAEFRRAAAWMETLGDPAEVSFVPGNHDAYVRAAMPMLKSIFEPWTTGNSATRPFPMCACAARLRSSGSARASRPRPLMATGKLGRNQLEALRRPARARPAKKGLARVAPHPSSAARQGRSALPRPDRRGGVRADGDRSRRRGVLHGHSHRRLVRSLPSPACRTVGGSRPGARRTLGGRGGPRPALSRGLPPGPFRARRRPLARQRPRKRSGAARRSDRRAGGVGGLSGPQPALARKRL